jgi:ribosomal protein S18 acetylase RimI-like enzyme
MATKMDMTLRLLKDSEIPILEDFLYLAVFIPAGHAPVSRDVIYHPAVYAYIENFGKKDDRCLVAQVGDRVIGAAWSRIMAHPAKRGYGNIDAHTPELAISVVPEHRGKGVGTRLLTALSDLLRDHGYSRLSLSVQKDNPALRLYQRAGFKTIAENEEDYIMVKQLFECAIEINRLHTTKMGEERIRRNLGLATDDVLAWCKAAVKNAPSSRVVRKGKNFYVSGTDCVLTINAQSHTIITAHRADK